MKPSINDIIEINQLLSLWGHVIDAKAWDRFADVLAEDASYDCSIFGFPRVCGIEAIQETFDREGHARAHHTTNVYVQEGPGEELRAQSKGLGLLSDGTVASVTFIDAFRRTPSGWRLASRELRFEPALSKEC